MGLIYNSNVEESKIYSAYGLTVYGKFNQYVWTMDNNKKENALITIRIEDSEGNNIFSMNMGNRCILQCRIDDTMDNFLYWIEKDQHDTYTIERQVLSSLCASNSLFNHSIRQRKEREKQKEEEEKRIAERLEEEKKQIDIIKDYCNRKGLFFYIKYGEVTILKATNNHDRHILAVAHKNDDEMQMVIDFIEKYPDNNGIKVVKRDTIKNIINYIK